MKIKILCNIKHFEMEKILVIIDNTPTFYIEATLDTTIKNIKLTLQNYLDNNRLDINQYNFVFNINRDTQVPVFFTRKYDEVTLESVFNQMKDPEIRITSKAMQDTKGLQVTKQQVQQKFTGNKDTDWLIINSLDDDALVSLCSTNKYLRNLCNEAFWEKRARQRLDDYAIRMKDIDMTWRNYYLKTIKNKFNIYNDSKSLGRKLYIGESPVHPEDPLIYSHVEKPKRSSKTFHVLLDMNKNLVSKLFTNRKDVLKLLRDAKGLLDDTYITIISEKDVIQQLY